MTNLNSFIDSINALKLKDEHLEIEARFQEISYKHFTSLFNVLRKKTCDVSISKSVVSIIREGTNIGRLLELKFPNGNGKVEKQFRRKEIILPPVIESSMIVPFKLTASTEQSLEPCDMNNADIIRIKIRFSFRLQEYSDWLFDLTIMRELSGQSAKSSLKTIVNSTFKNIINVDNVFDVLQCDHNQKLYKYEVETEYIGKENITKDNILTTASFIINSIDPAFSGGSQYNQHIIDIANIIEYKKRLNRYTLKEILPQVELLTKNYYCKKFPPQNMFVTDKADGLRCVVIVKNSELIIITNQIQSPCHKLDIDPSIHIIADAELVNDIAYVFDVIKLNDINLVKQGYEQRHSYIPEVVSLINHPNVQGKKIYALSDNLENAIDSALKEDDLYERDGLIFIDGGQSYSNTKSLKWKPLKHTTIDFLAKKYNYAVPSYIKLKDDHDLYFLFNGISADNFLMMGMKICDNYKKLFNSSSSVTSNTYFPIQFSPSTCPYAYIYQHPKDGPPIDGKVIELGLTKYNTTSSVCIPDWKLTRIRTDRDNDVNSQKYFGNDFRIAELTWNIFLDPLTLDELKKGCNKSYFMETKGTIYFAQVSALSFIKERRIEKNSGTEWVIDLCSGRGADLGRFIRNKVQNLVCIDQDRTALSELIKRKYDIVNNVRLQRSRDKKPTWSRKKGTSISVISADVSDRKQVISKTKNIIPKAGADLIICNFAVHYFLESSTSLNNFITLCKDLLKPGGQLVLTFMIGELIFDILKDVSINESIDTYDHVIKNSLKKLYKDNLLLPTGQKIGVLLPFSQGEYYEEYLVNTEFLKEQFTNKGFTCGEVTNAKTYIPDFKHKFPQVYNLLNNDDKWYLDLFGELIITKD